MLTELLQLSYVFTDEGHETMTLKAHEKVIFSAFHAQSKYNFNQEIYPSKMRK